MSASISEDTPDSPQPAVTDGPMVGGLVGGAGPNSAAARFFVRFSFQGTARIYYSKNPDMSDFHTSDPATAIADSDYTARIAVTGLTNDVQYWCRVTISNAPPPIQLSYPTFRTPPADGTDSGQFSFAFIADCLNVTESPGRRSSGSW